MGVILGIQKFQVRDALSIIWRDVVVSLVNRLRRSIAGDFRIFRAREIRVDGVREGKSNRSVERERKKVDRVGF